LLRRYGRDRPATGFAVDLDSLESTLFAAGAAIVAPPAPHGCLVVCLQGTSSAGKAAANAETVRLRARGNWAFLDGAIDRSHAEDLARRRGVAELMVFGAQADPIRLILSGDVWIGAVR
jgi:ATP phosphoribosyltransferase regulatory subunit HisZ